MTLATHVQMPPSSVHDLSKAPSVLQSHSEDICNVKVRWLGYNQIRNKCIPREQLGKL